jgi:hypothetical protein
VATSLRLDWVDIYRFDGQELALAARLPVGRYRATSPSRATAALCTPPCRTATSSWRSISSATCVIRLLRAGDAAGLEALMEAYAARVYRLAHGVTQNLADAEEVVQDVFLTVARKIAEFEGRSALSTWIYRITMNTALNKRRGKRSEVEVSLEEHLPTFKDDAPGGRPELSARRLVPDARRGVALGGRPCRGAPRHRRLA